MEDLLIGLYLLVFISSICGISFLIKRWFHRRSWALDGKANVKFRLIEVIMILDLYDTETFTSEGKTNRQLMVSGFAPYTKNGERVILKRHRGILGEIWISEHTKSSVKKNKKEIEELDLSTSKKFTDEKLAAWSKHYWQWRAKKMK